MKKQMIRCASFMLAALMAVPSFASCGGDTSAATDTQAATEAQTEVETLDPNDRSLTKDSLPDGLDFGGRKFGVYCASTKRNEEFFAGLGEETGEVVEDAVYRRNQTVQERLNFVFSPTPMTLAGTRSAAKYRSSSWQATPPMTCSSAHRQALRSSSPKTYLSMLMTLNISISPSRGGTTTS